MAYRLKGAYTPAREDGEVSLYALVRKMTVEELEDFLERKIFPERRSTTSGHTSISPEIADIRRTRLYPRRRRARQGEALSAKGAPRWTLFHRPRRGDPSIDSVRPSGIAGTPE